MATVIIGLLNYTSINTAESTTGWTSFDTLDPDIKKEGSNGITGVFRSDLDDGYYDHGSAPITAVGKHVRFWLNTTNVAYLETLANGGYELIMFDGTTSEYKVMFSSEDYSGGWFNMVFDCGLFSTLTLANVQRWGIRVNHHTAAKNVDNVWLDYIRYLDGYYVTGGTDGDELDLALIAARDADDGAGTLRGYGVVTEIDGVFFCTGKLTIGNSATTTFFKMDGEVLAFVDNPVAANFYEMSAGGTVADIVINDSTILAAGTADNVRFVFDMSAANVLEMSGAVLNRAAAVTFATGQNVIGCTFNDCYSIVHGGADLNGSTVKNYEGTANTSALIYNVNADPDGEMDDMVFTKGTAITHAIEFGTTSPLTMTLTGCTFNGYNASNAQNDSTFHIKRTSGTVTINIVSGTGNVSYRTDGAIVVIQSTVPITITVKDEAGSPIENAQTAIYAGTGTSGRTEIMNEDTNALGIASESYAGTTPAEVEVRCRKASPGETKYINFSSVQIISTSGLSLAVTMIEDPNNNAT